MDQINRIAIKPRVPLPMPNSIDLATARHFCVCIPDIHDGMLNSFAKGVEAYFSEKGINTKIISSSMSRTRQTDLIHMALENGLDGAILVPAPGTTIGDLHAFTRRDIPLLVAFEEVIGSSLAFVAPDLNGGAFEVTARLTREGHSRIGFVGSRVSPSLSRHAWQGLQQALGQAGIPVDLKFAHFPGQVGLDPRVIAESLSQSGVTAVICVDREFARKLDESLGMLSLAALETISLVTFADQESPIMPRIKRVRFDCRSLGYMAASLLEEIRLGTPSTDRVQVPARLD